MTKIEPMNTEDMRVLLHAMKAGPLCEPDCDLATHRLILAWIDAEARAREAEFWRYHWDEKDMGKPCWCKDSHVERHKWDSADWLAAVKREVGWPEDQNNE